MLNNKDSSRLRFLAAPKRVRLNVPRVFCVLISLGLMACSSLASTSTFSGTRVGPGGAGATPGGVKDMGLARQLIREGVVPPESAFVVEGMFSEHDLPLDGDECRETLCIRGAGAITANADQTRAGWIQVGLSSSIDLDSFVRPRTAVIFVVDVSGSMGWGVRGSDSPGEISRTLLSAIAAQLNENDAVALVAYGSDVSVPLALQAGGSSALSDAIGALATNGSTNLEAGLQRGFAIARTAKSQDASRAVRVMLFTDEQPNVGATDASTFGGMVRSAADEGIATTVFGMGNGLGQGIFLAMSHLHGGNGFSLFQQSDVAQTMEENWPWMVAPVAYDLHVDVSPSHGLGVVRGHGFPDATAGSAATLGASSVFLSRNRGALLVELSGDSQALSGGHALLSLSYQNLSGIAVEQSLEVALPTLANENQAFAQPGVRSTVALAQLVEGMRAASHTYATDHAAAIAILQTARTQFAEHLSAGSDPSLNVELELVDALLLLMQRDAAQRS